MLIIDHAKTYDAHLVPSPHDTRARRRPVVLLLKATVKKQIYVPQYVKGDGTVVPGHVAMVHVAADHDEHKLLAGQGTYSQKHAHAKLHKESWFQKLPDAHKAPVFLHHATALQDAASQSASLSLFKKKLTTGQQATHAEWKAYGAQAKHKREAIAEEVKAAGHAAKFDTGYQTYLKHAGTEAHPNDPKPIGPTPEQVQHETNKAKLLDQVHAAKLPTSNSNHKVVNAKLQAIHDAAHSGNTHALLHMGYGSNTYAKHAVKLANQALALHGSPHQVSLGQKSGTHAALQGANEPHTASAAPKVVAASPSVAKPKQPVTKPSAAAKQSKPKDGDTKTENGVQYVLFDGRWHKIDEDPASIAHTKSKQDATNASKRGAKSDSKSEANANAKPQATPSQASHLIGELFHNTEPGHDKFWAAAIDGHQLVTHYGKVGSKGVYHVKEFATPAQAKAAYDHKVAQKLQGKYQALGKVKLTKPAAPTPTTQANQATQPAPKPAAPKVVGAKTNSATATAASTATPSIAQPVTAIPINDWKQTGPQKGYNPGGTYTDPQGQNWYCKFPQGGEKVVKNEMLASKLYALAGLAATETQLVQKDNKVGIASKIIPDLKQDKAALLSGSPKGLLSGFAVDAWLANWDAIGNNPAKGYDNILVNGAGQAIRIDAGGALNYGGAGGKKSTFGAKVIELKTMLDPNKNAHTAAVFGKMSQADITASVAKVAAIPDAEIHALCQQYGPGTDEDKAALAKILIARKADMLKQYPDAAKIAAKLASQMSTKSTPAKKPKTIKFDPAKLGAVPDFMNWKGPGKAGPSSDPVINQANQDAAYKMHKVAAETGSIAAIKALTFPVYAKDGSKAGAVVGHKPALEHPSQYVKGYAQQLINEIDTQLNPPRPFRWKGDSPLAALDKAYPKIKDVTKSGLDKLGYYVRLGKPGVLTNADAGLHEKLSWKSGKLTQATYAKQAQAATAKLPAQQKDALKSYTGSGYHAINQSLWTGNPGGAAKSAEEALLTLGHTVQPGTLLSRKIKMSGSDLAALKNAAGSVLQEPAVMSTSIRPTCWSGNVHFKITVGPGVKGLYVGPGSTAKGALSVHASEDELLLPPNTRLLVQSVKAAPTGKGDEDGFGADSQWLVEVLVLPT